jgi:hypothetical protein
MGFKTITLQNLSFYVSISLMVVLTSCGSLQQSVSFDNGLQAINANSETIDKSTTPADSEYYKNYFAESTVEFNAIKKESIVFTNINTYKAKSSVELQSSLEEPSYGGWGQNGTVSINIIDNRFFGNIFQSWAPWGQVNQWGWYRNKSGNWVYNSRIRLSFAFNPYTFTPRWAIGFGCGYSFGCGWNQPGRDAYRNNGFNNRATWLAAARGNSIIADPGSNAAISRRDYSTRQLASASALTSNNRSIRSSSRTNRNSLGLSRTNRTTVRHESPTSSNNTRISRPVRSTRSSGTIRSSGSTRSVRSTTPSTRSSSPSRSIRSSNSSRSSAVSTSSNNGRQGRL